MTPQIWMLGAEPAVLLGCTAPPRRSRHVYTTFLFKSVSRLEKMHKIFFQNHKIKHEKYLAGMLGCWEADRTGTT